MPRLSCWFIRASLIYLAVGFTFGALILLNKGIPLAPMLWRLLPAHIEFLLLGWMGQLAVGVAFWILPRFSTERGRPVAAYLTFFLLNIGVLLTSIGSALLAPTLLLVLGRFAEVGSAVALAIHAWPRVKPPGDGSLPRLLG